MGHIESPPIFNIRSSYSLLERQIGINKPSSIVSKSKEFGYENSALVDPNCYGWIEFIDECNKQSLNPVIGIRSKYYLDLTLPPEEALFIPINSTGVVNTSYLASSVMQEGHVITQNTIKNIEGVVVIVLGNKAYYKELFNESHHFFGASFDDDISGLPKDKIIPTQPFIFISQKDVEVYNILNRIYPLQKDINPEKIFSYILPQSSVFKNRYLTKQYLLEQGSELIRNININYPFQEEIRPKIVPNEIENTYLYLEQLINKEVSRQNGNYQRAQAELAVMKQLGFSNSFLFSYEFSQYLRKSNIAWNVLGSANNSYLLYLLGVTKVNPLTFSFAGFINPGRKKGLPDIDFQIPYEQITEAFRYFEIEYPQIANRLTVMHHYRDASTSRITTSDYEKKLVEEYDLPKNVSTHASGVILLSHPPLNHLGNAQITKDDVDIASILKFDLLPRSLFHIVNSEDLNSDKEIYSRFKDGDTIGIPACESPHLRAVIMKVLKNTNYPLDTSLSHALSIARLPYSQRERYFDQKHKDLFSSYPGLTNILEKSRFTFIFQEQIRDFAELVGYSYLESEQIRKIASNEINLYEKNILLANLFNKLELHYPSEVRDAIKEQIISFTSYSFKEGHSYALSREAIRHMYLLINQPNSFYGKLLKRITEQPGSYYYYPQLYINLAQRKVGLNYPSVEEIEMFPKITKQGLNIGYKLFAKNDRFISAYSEYLNLLQKATPRDLIAYAFAMFRYSPINPIYAFNNNYYFNKEKRDQRIIGQVMSLRKYINFYFVTFDSDNVVDARIYTQTLNKNKSTLEIGNLYFMNLRQNGEKGYLITDISSIDNLQLF